MATGGTIPSNRTQTVSFYNTSAVVEKDKNIYYVPRFSKTGATAGQQVRTAYLNAFEVVCPPSSAYSNITVSQWSPQDRTLRVRGNIDDFRAVTDEGECLNYFIISRTIQKTNGETVTSQVFYYAFFITNVAQVGGGSVELTIEPDDFTNVFYLHNKHELTQLNIDNDYEPFNEKMANCYVKRQHYNRVGNPVYHKYYTFRGTSYMNFPTNLDHTYEFTIQTLEGQVSLGRFKMTRQPTLMEGVYVTEFYDLDTSRPSAGIPHEYISITDVSVTPQVGWYVNVTGWVKNNTKSYDTYDPVNMKIFMNQEESFKFKYQYRDDKYPISPYDGQFTKEERNAIEEADTIFDLSSDLRKKVLLCCISYLVIETKSPEVCYKYFNIINSAVSSTKTLSMGERIDSGINRPNPVLCYPFINSPEVFKKFNLETQVFMNATINGFNAEYSGGTPLPYERNQRIVREIINRINHNSISDYIYSAYILRDIGLKKDKISTFFNASDNWIRFTYNLTLPTPITGTSYRYVEGEGFYAGGLRSKVTEDVSGEGINVYISSGEITDVDGYYIGIMVSNIDKREYSIDLSILGDLPNSLRTNYYDPTLEAEPYKFYSISTHGNYELVFNKNRYYSTGRVYLDYYYSVNGGIKISFIPNYTVDDVITPYFNEGLVFTLASSLPLVSDSYSSYYNQNMAQMKNQYAVADKNFQYDILQHFFVSGPNAVGMSATKRGWVGAVSETGNQLMQMVDETVDYFQNKEIIGMNQRAKLADVGNAPDTLKQAGSELLYDLKTNENCLFLNHYTIDDLSYNSIAKILERVGYSVNLYDRINAMNRVGWNYVQLIGFDYKPTVEIMTSQEEKIRQIFLNGVTLLHDKTYLTTGHNYETILE